MSALPVEHPYRSDVEGTGFAPALSVTPWPLLLRQPGPSFLQTLLDDPDRSRRLSQLPADLLIGVPLAVVGRAASRFQRVRTWATTD